MATLIAPITFSPGADAEDLHKAFKGLYICLISLPILLKLKKKEFFFIYQFVIMVFLPW